MTDFEEITVPGSDDDNSSIDSCEEVIIPDVPDPYGGKDCPCDCHLSSTEARVVNKNKHCVKCGIKVGSFSSFVYKSHEIIIQVL